MIKKGVLGRYLILLAMVGACGGLLLHTSQNVQRKEDELRALNMSLKRERQTIEVLEAEWTHLNSPYRLERLVVDHLDMVPPEAVQIMPDPRLLPVAQDNALGAAVESDLKIEIVVDGEASVLPGRKPAIERAIKAPMVTPAPAEPAPKDDMSGLLDRLGGAQ